MTSMPGVAEAHGNDLRSPVVTVQAGFRNDYSDLPRRGGGGGVLCFHTPCGLLRRGSIGRCD